MGADSLFMHHVVYPTVRLFQFALFNQLLIFDACIGPHEEASGTIVVRSSSGTQINAHCKIQW